MKQTVSESFYIESDIKGSGHKIGRLLFWAINGDDSAALELEEYLDQPFADDLNEALLDATEDNPVAGEMRRRLICLGLSPCMLLEGEVVNMVETLCVEITLTEEERKVIKTCYRNAGFKNQPLPQ